MDPEPEDKRATLEERFGWLLIIVFALTMWICFGEYSPP